MWVQDRGCGQGLGLHHIHVQQALVTSEDACMQALQRLGAQQTELPASLQQAALAACHSIALAGGRAGQEHVIPDLLDSLEQVCEAVRPVRSG